MIDKNGEPLVLQFELDAIELLRIQPSRATPASIGDQYTMIGYDLPRSVAAGDVSFARIYLQIDESLPKPAVITNSSPTWSI